MEKQNPIKDLIKLFVTENYKKYLTEKYIVFFNANWQFHQC